MINVNLIAKYLPLTVGYVIWLVSSSWNGRLVVEPKYPWAIYPTSFCFICSQHQHPLVQKFLCLHLAVSYSAWFLTMIDNIWNPQESIIEIQDFSLDPFQKHSAFILIKGFILCLYLVVSSLSLLAYLCLTLWTWHSWLSSGPVINMFPEGICSDPTKNSKRKSQATGALVVVDLKIDFVHKSMKEAKPLFLAVTSSNQIFLSLGCSMWCQTLHNEPTCPLPTARPLLS